MGQEGKQEFVVEATNLLLNHWWNLPRFFSLTQGVQRQLRETPGLVRYRLKASFLKLQFSTLSIWESQEAVNDFARKGAHLAAIQALPTLAKAGTAFVRWTATEPNTVTWEEAFQRLQNPTFRHGADSADGRE